MSVRADGAGRDGSELVGVLERAWADIRRRHIEVPATVMITGAGSGRRGLRLGHFAAGRWSDRGGQLGELFVAGEGLERGAEDILVTLLHEAAHALAHARGIRDTSRQGRYHNRRYRAVARELGLDVAYHPHLGWTDTTLAEGTAQEYERAVAELAELSRSLKRERERRPSAGEPAAGAAMIGCVCGCGRRIRVSRRTLSAGAISCALCEQPFQPTVGDVLSSTKSR